jgi:hypothetical protein
MTLTQFRDKAIDIAKKHGINEHSVTVLAGSYGFHSSSSIYYSVKAWHKDSLTHITSALQPNPESALENFKQVIDSHFKVYSKEIFDIEIN